MMRWMLIGFLGLAVTVRAQAPSAVVRGSDEWLFLSAELRSLGAAPFWGSGVTNRDPLPAIVDFHEQLKAAGVRLVLVPVPPKALVMGRHLETPPDGATLQRWYDVLRAKGVDVLDLTSAFTAAGDPPPYCKTDSHWSGRGIALAADAIAAHVGDLVAKGDGAFTATPRRAEITGDLTKLPGGIFLRPEPVDLETVATADGKPVAQDESSPLLLLGDSHTLVFHAGGDMHATGAGLADHLALRLGRPVDVLGVRGSGATTSRISLMRRIKTNPDYMDTKKVVVWCFAAREFTEADTWRLVPLLLDPRTP